ncbi:MAG: hypothetical protein PVI04_07695, partial [Anaerolineales bacterium]
AAWWKLSQGWKDHALSLARAARVIDSYYQFQVGEPFIRNIPYHPEYFPTAGLLALLDGYIFDLDKRGRGGAGCGSWGCPGCLLYQVGFAGERGTAGEAESANRQESSSAHRAAMLQV